jgi:hypothetical protein
MGRSEFGVTDPPVIADARIVPHPGISRDCLLITTEDGEKIAFAFEVESDRPGLEVVEPELWQAAAAAGARDDSALVFAAVKDANADAWLQVIATHPVGEEWLNRIRNDHPDSFHRWFAQVDYEEGGEQGSG